MPIKACDKQKKAALCAAKEACFMRQTNDQTDFVKDFFAPCP